MRSLPATAVVLAAILLVAGTRWFLRKEPPSPVNGQLIAQTYTNSTFGFSVAVPTNWSVMDRATLEKGINEKLPRPTRRSIWFGWRNYEMPEMEPHYLLTLAEEPAGRDATAGKPMTSTNCTLKIRAQNFGFLSDLGQKEKEIVPRMLSALATMDDVRDYEDDRTEAIQPGGPVEVSVGGRTFMRDTFEHRKRGVTMIRRIYVRSENRYLLQFVLIAPTEPELDKLEQIVATVRFH